MDERKQTGVLQSLKDSRWIVTAGEKWNPPQSIPAELKGSKWDPGWILNWGAEDELGALGL